MTPEGTVCETPHPRPGRLNPARLLRCAGADRLLGILHSPTRSPYGNPIPGLRDLGLDHDHVPFREGVVPLSEVVPNRGEVTVTMERMSENLQADAEVLSALASLGLRPGVEFVVRRVGIDLRFCVGDDAVTVDEAVAELLFVAAR